MLSYTIDINSKYAWLIPLKDKKGITILMLFKIFFKRIYSQTKQSIGRQRQLIL